MTTIYRLRADNLVFTFLLGLSLPAQATPKPVTIRLLNGRNGKPMVDERLLVFFGASPEGVRFHKGGSMDLHTNADGEAALPVNRPSLAYVQVFVDLRTLCQSTPNYRSFSLEEIRQNGTQSPNNCGRQVQLNSPGRLIVYARDATLREKMTR